MFTGLNTPEDYFRVIKNHKWLIIVPIVLCVAVAAALCQWLPKTYRSSTVLYFESQKVRYVKGVDAPEAGVEKPDAAMAARLESMKKILYKQELLTRVADEFHLYGYDKQTATPAQDERIASSLRSVVYIVPKGHDAREYVLCLCGTHHCKSGIGQASRSLCGGKHTVSQRDYSKFS